MKSKLFFSLFIVLLFFGQIQATGQSLDQYDWNFISTEDVTVHEGTLSIRYSGVVDFGTSNTTILGTSNVDNVHVTIERGVLDNGTYLHYIREYNSDMSNIISSITLPSELTDQFSGAINLDIGKNSTHYQILHGWNLYSITENLDFIITSIRSLPGLEQYENTSVLSEYSGENLYVLNETQLGDDFSNYTLLRSNVTDNIGNFTEMLTFKALTRYSTNYGYTGIRDFSITDNTIFVINQTKSFQESWPYNLVALTNSSILFDINPTSGKFKYLNNNCGITSDRDYVYVNCGDFYQLSESSIINYEGELITKLSQYYYYDEFTNQYEISKRITLNDENSIFYQVKRDSVTQLMKFQKTTINSQVKDQFQFYHGTSYSNDTIQITEVQFGDTFIGTPSPRYMNISYGSDTRENETEYLSYSNFDFLSIHTVNIENGTEIKYNIVVYNDFSEIFTISIEILAINEALENTDTSISSETSSSSETSTGPGSNTGSSEVEINAFFIWPMVISLFVLKLRQRSRDKTLISS